MNNASVQEPRPANSVATDPPDDGTKRPLPKRLHQASANFWREFMYFWTAHWPPFVLLTRPFFLFFALRFSKALRDGPAANARRILGRSACDADVERLRRAIVRSAYTSIYELGRATARRRLSCARGSSALTVPGTTTRPENLAMARSSLPPTSARSKWACRR